MCVQTFQAYCERTLAERRHAFAAIRHSRGPGRELPRELIQRVLAYASEIPWLIERAPYALYPRCMSVRVRVWLGEQLILEHPIGGRNARWMRLEGPRSEDGRRMTLRCSVMRDGVDLWVGEVYDDPHTMPWTHYSAFRSRAEFAPIEAKLDGTTVRVACTL